MKPVYEQIFAPSHQIAERLPNTQGTKWKHHDDWPFSWVRLGDEVRIVLTDRVRLVWDGAATLAGPLVALELA